MENLIFQTERQRWYALFAMSVCVVSVLLFLSYYQPLIGLGFQTNTLQANPWLSDIGGDVLVNNLPKNLEHITENVLVIIHICTVGVIPLFGIILGIIFFLVSKTFVDKPLNDNPSNSPIRAKSDQNQHRPVWMGVKRRMFKIFGVLFSMFVVVFLVRVCAIDIFGMKHITVYSLYMPCVMVSIAQCCGILVHIPLSRQYHDVLPPEKQFRLFLKGISYLAGFMILVVLLRAMFGASGLPEIVLRLFVISPVFIVIYLCFVNYLFFWKPKISQEQTKETNKTGEFSNTLYLCTGLAVCLLAVNGVPETWIKFIEGLRPYLWYVAIVIQGATAVWLMRSQGFSNVYEESLE